MTLVAAIQALKHDAQVWQDVAEATNRAGQHAQDLTLGEAHLSWASNPTGLLATYTEAQAKVAALLGEGTRVFTDLSAALDIVAHAYELDDERAAARLKGTWDTRD